MAFYNQPLFPHAYFEPQLLIKEGRTPVQPLGYSKLSYWTWNEIGELLLGQLLEVGHPLLSLIVRKACLD